MRGKRMKNGKWKEVDKKNEEEIRMKWEREEKKKE